MILESLEKLISYLGSTWQLLDRDEKWAIMQVWLGYLQLGANEMLKVWEAEVNKSIATAPVKVPRLWQPLQFHYYYPMEYEAIGRPAAKYTATVPTPEILISWKLIG